MEIRRDFYIYHVSRFREIMSSIEGVSTSVISTRMEHVLRTVKIAVDIACKQHRLVYEKVPKDYTVRKFMDSKKDDTLDIIFLAALYHDVTKLSDKNNHGLSAFSVVKEIAKDPASGITPVMLDALEKILPMHSFKSYTVIENEFRFTGYVYEDSCPDTEELNRRYIWMIAKLLRDADIVEKLTLSSILMGASKKPNIDERIATIKERQEVLRLYKFETASKDYYDKGMKTLGYVLSTLEEERESMNLMNG